MSNLKLPCYMMSKFVLQALLGLIQSIILTLVFLSLVGNSKKGIFFSDFRPEMLFTVWLTVIASVAMGFIISSVVQSGDKAMAAAPFVLIVQIFRCWSMKQKAFSKQRQDMYGLQVES